MPRPLVVLTGAGREGQVGEAVAAAFAAHGATLALLDIAADQADARAAALRAVGHPATGYGVDLADAEATVRVAERIRADHPDAVGVDTLVCLAGGFGLTGPLDASAPADFQRQLTINLLTAYGATRAFLPALRAARGSVVYVGSIAALPGGDLAATAAYGAAKAGVLALMRSVAQAEAAHGVRANAIAPSAIRTAANVAAMGEGVRYVTREQVAEAIRWLADPANAFVTGQVVALQ